MTEAVLDASVAIDWALGETQAVAAFLRDGIPDHHFIVPPVWTLEVTNALLKAERRKKIDADYLAKALVTIGQMNIRYTPDPFDHDIAKIIDLARPFQLSSYDASYLALAELQRLPLCTRDNNLIQAAKRLNILVWPHV